MANLRAWLAAFYRQYRLGAWALIATVVLMIALGIQGSQLRNDTAAPLGVVSLELANDAAEAAEVINSWKGHEQIARRQVWLDVPFILAYAAALFYWGRVAARTARRNQVPGLAAAANLAAWGGLLAGLSDLFENCGLLAMLDGSTPTDAIAARTSCFAAIKFVLIAAAISMPAVAALSQRAHGSPPLSWGFLFRVTRPVLGVVVFTAIALLLPPQTADMLASLSLVEPRGLWSALVFNFSLAMLALASWFWSRALLSARFGASDTQAGRTFAVQRYGGSVAPLNWIPRILFVAAAAIGIVAAIRSHAWWQVLFITAWTIVGVLLLYRRVGLPAPVAVRATAAPADPALAKMPEPETGIGPLLRHTPSRRWIGRVVLLLGLLLFTIGAIGSLFPESLGFLGTLTDEVGYAFPGPSAALIGLALLLGPLAAVTAASDRIRFFGQVGGLPWRMHPPVFLLLLAFVLVVPSLINLHAVRLAPSAPATAVRQRAGLDELFKNWAAKCQPGATVRPLIVAVSGGASRAGLWGARVLSEADALAAAGKTGVFAVSSVSGGSLGAAAYVATMAGQEPSACSLSAPNRERFVKAVVASLGDDALGPLLAGSLFGDMPRALLAIPAHLVRRAYYALAGMPVEAWRGGDRADALESAFERIWRGAAKPSAAVGAPLPFSRPFLGLTYDLAKPPSDASRLRQSPVWIANGTDAQNGVRVLTVPFRDAESVFLGAHDALSLLGRDVPVSTAIHNTARFPFLSPAGELSSVRGRLPGEVADGGGPVQLIDGGYFENEGLLTAWELARYLERNGERLLGPGRTVQPVLIQATADADRNIPETRIIRCGREAPPIKQRPAAEPPSQSLAKSRPLQAAIPLLGLYSVRGGHSDWILRQVREQYCPGGSRTGAAGGGNDQRFYHYYLYRLGEDVPLNWTLSQHMSCRIWQAMSYNINDGKTANPNLAESSALATLFGAQPPGRSAAEPPGELCGKPSAN